MAASHPGRRYCSEVSSDHHEPLTATASRIDHWLLVEYRGLWGPNAVRASGLSDQVKRNLREQLRAREHTRLLFIRRPDRRGSPELRAFAATSSQGRETLRAATLLRGVLFLGDRGRMYREAADWLGSARIPELLGR